MIHYQLRCAAGHEFDGWFNDSAGFEAQSTRGMLSCPSCGSAKVGRALMSPGIPAKSRRARSAAPQAASADATPSAAAPPDAKLPIAGGPMPDAVRAALHKLRAEVETHCDYVGPEFATEARRIHNGEAKPRGIYGESTEAQAEALADDGIDVARIPWLPRADS